MVWHGLRNDYETMKRRTEQTVFRNVSFHGRNRLTKRTVYGATDRNRKILQITEKSAAVSALRL